MTTQPDYRRVNDLLRLHSGEWIEIRRDKHNRIHALISKWRKAPPTALRSGRFEFKVKGLQYGSGETRLLARHVHATFPVDA